MCHPTCPPVRALLLTKTRGFRHDCIPAFISAMESFPFEVSATEDSAALLALSQYDVVILGHNTGTFLTDPEVDALRDFVENGGGVVGVHAATSGMSTDDRYRQILGEVFNGHPPPQWSVIKLESCGHYITNAGILPQTVSATLPTPPCSATPDREPSSRFLWFDEVYNFKCHPRRVKGREILLSVCKPSDDAAGEPTDYPLAWCHTVGKGRVFYTALGHFDEAYSDSWFLETLRRAIVWVANQDDCT
ncbi:glycosyl hydrolase [Fusarium albosuccineum]|uniref:Glycosyl hydrolase n=1 Tax=Fusarium albosuccineum TaxID=1237068 RepID=A0A8H4PEP1_9HYPO|nr:glycosyl hydrolase [Fusarium albosuccineum]